ncbi:MAG: hypothetical protein L3J93_06330 [Thermoplasmata archaeon]|nr:hypothetical protein [Thermoplasmata archaeon]
MSPVRLADVRRIASGRGRKPSDADGIAIEQALREYRSQAGPPLSPFSLEVDGRPYTSFLDALDDSSASFRTARLRLSEPPADPESWRFLRPWSSIDLGSDGSAQFLAPKGAPDRALARFRLVDRYDPGRGVRMPPQLGGPFPLAAFVAWMRDRSILPLGIVLDLYFPSERIRYPLDLVRGVALPDRRAGRLPEARFVRRPTRVSWELDRRLAGGELSPIAVRTLETLAEVNGASEAELESWVGGSVRESLKVLTQSHLATQDTAAGTYHLQLEALMRPASRTSSSAGSAVAGSALREGVTELLAAAEARATCPLCGDLLPPGYTRLLCAKCEGEVGGVSRAPR